MKKYKGSGTRNTDDLNMTSSNQLKSEISEGNVGLSFLEKLKQPRKIKFSDIGKNPLLFVTTSKNGYVELYYITKDEIVEYFRSSYTNLISQEKDILSEIDSIINLNRTYNTYMLYEL